MDGMGLSTLSWGMKGNQGLNLSLFGLFTSLSSRSFSLLSLSLFSLSHSSLSLSLVLAPVSSYSLSLSLSVFQFLSFFTLCLSQSLM